MSTYNWKEFLTQWSKGVLSTELERAFPSEIRASGWIGYPGATEAQIAWAEARLKTTLPLSYREFLKVANGWPMVAPLLGRFWSTEEIEWLATRRSSLIEDWMMGQELYGQIEPVSDEEYFVYGKEQDSISMRVEYLRSALEISDFDARDGAIYLLNPQVVTPEGEWEAWYLASWLPGATRYCSFWEMMQAEYESFLDSREYVKEYTQEYIEYVKKRLSPSDDPQMLVVKLPDLIETLQREIEVYRSSMEPVPGRPSLRQYQQGVIEGLQVAETRLREIQTQTQDPQELRKQLRALADELDSRGRQGIQAAMKDFDLGRILSGGISEIERQVQSSAKPTGYRNAAGMIRSFLNEQ
jgi:hypothetical protein